MSMEARNKLARYMESIDIYNSKIEEHPPGIIRLILTIGAMKEFLKKYYWICVNILDTKSLTFLTPSGSLMSSLWCHIIYSTMNRFLLYQDSIYSNTAFRAVLKS